jgi:hypothetical protein
LVQVQPGASEKENKMKPVIGQIIYVPSNFYIDRGEDDFVGGLATINKIEYHDFLPVDHINYCMVGIENRPGHMYNWKILIKQQEELKIRFGNNKSYPDPDC